MRVLQINASVNSGSTGRIAEDIGAVLMQNGHESIIAAGRTIGSSKSEVIHIGSKLDTVVHGLCTAVLDRHGFASTGATKRLAAEIKNIKPDVIGLHNIHGYYLNVEVLFETISTLDIPVVWTLHDCWAFTGHCSYFDSVECYKWQTECHHCPKTRFYPSSYILDQSRRNYQDKKRLFNLPRRMQLVTPSMWLLNHVNHSFLNSYPVACIYNGIDMDVFSSAGDNSLIREKYGLGDANIVLGVASIWDPRKGLNDFVAMNDLIGNNARIVLVGLSAEQLKQLPEGMVGIARTENVQELAMLYSCASVFANPTYQDNFPTTNIEALACGTPVVTYNTGGSPEAIDEYTGAVVSKGDVNGMWAQIQKMIARGKKSYTVGCRQRAVDHFDKKKKYLDYIALYHGIQDEQ